MRCIAKTSVAPLDRVKILFQTRAPDYARYAGTWMGVFKASQDIYAETGVRGLLQGHSATLLRIFPYAAIKFMAYENSFRLRSHHVRQVLMPTTEQETGARRFLAGSLAGVTSALFTYPLELIRVRLAFETHHSLAERSSLTRTIRQIYQASLIPPPPVASTSNLKTASAPSSTPLPTTPIKNLRVGEPSLTHFYRGIFPTLFGIVPYAGVSFLVWGFLKTDLVPTMFSPSTRERHRTWIDLAAGGIAGALGQTSAYPLDIIRRRMQVGPVLPGGGGARHGFWDTARTIYKAHGWRGYFVGLSIGYLKVIPMNSVSFASWVALKNAFGLEGVSQGAG
ncbi:BZ3500_MvSof-1268-A1-R1_Chr3-1g05727 [Microbotryum saponariae]|uniref:BZ3500_MvSof-1268-A1-R1_Chr3-1g05727 protein n=1 Tax=Microbotryum saponariae TaxID=289078 RepID=A0A2X0KXR7_9BASI|nr:BZ3500_MvSof-1268-A1-R1_Chr3-1g05727 [Microbotryum saponariae]SDA04917.1 BZ3501_MvSof-1269-A2-R1_Chr3-1g05397 [Microbotryum saponariae]